MLRLGKLSVALIFLFSKLGHEEYFTCEVFSKHSKESIHSINLECEDCVAWSRHHEKYKLARTKYQKDYDGPDVVITADLQKVIILPRCDTFKEVIFDHRLVDHNESLFSVGKKAKVPPFAVVWHEAIAGRSKRDIISAFYQYFLQLRNIENVVLWLDNCSASK